MSKLPNAPLIEIVLELRWKITNKVDLSKIQYLYGDIYNELKHKHPYRENIQPPEIPIEVLLNQPVHRFRTAQNDYPLFQVGPGIITLNTIDSKYFWESFYNDSSELVNTFLNVFPIKNGEKLTPSILFLDFFPFNFKENDVYKFISDKFNVKFEQSFIKNVSNPKDVNLGFYYEISLGDLSVVFHKGNSNHKEGIVLQTRINGAAISPDLDNIKLWIGQAHDTCSDLFKKLTEGKLYESFKS
jgi:uncharacterized protein (TIGR04255 family)